MRRCDECPSGEPARALTFADCMEAIELRDKRAPLVARREAAQILLNQIDVELAAVDVRLAAIGVDPTS